jgi:diacylglycerol O-acyltransferase / wax synthase
VNDVVLAIVTGAIRHFLQVHRDYPVEGLEFRAMAPVSVRMEHQRGALGNQVAMWLVELPVGEPDPAAWVHAIAGRDPPSEGDRSGPGGGHPRRVLQRHPGHRSCPSPPAGRQRPPSLQPDGHQHPRPQFPMYLLEARMVANYPIVPLWAQHGLGLALFSYDGRL